MCLLYVNILVTYCMHIALPLLTSDTHLAQRASANASTATANMPIIEPATNKVAL